MKLEQWCVTNSISYEFNKLMRQLTLAAVHLLGLSITLRVIDADNARRDKTSDNFLITFTFPPPDSQKRLGCLGVFKVTEKTSSLLLESHTNLQAASTRTKLLLMTEIISLSTISQQEYAGRYKKLFFLLFIRHRMATRTFIKLNCRYNLLNETPLVLDRELEQQHYYLPPAGPCLFEGFRNLTGPLTARPWARRMTFSRLFDTTGLLFIGLSPKLPTAINGPLVCGDGAT